MKTKSLAPFFSDVQCHFQPYVNLFAGRNCWPRAVEHWSKNGRGSTLALDFGQDPTDLLWPAHDRIVLVHCVDYRLWRYTLLEKALRRDGAEIVVGVVGDEFFIDPEQCGKEASC
jgi:hypothetical protein